MQRGPAYLREATAQPRRASDGEPLRVLLRCAHLVRGRRPTAVAGDLTRDQRPVAPQPQTDLVFRGCGEAAGTPRDQPKPTSRARSIPPNRQDQMLRPAEPKVCSD